ncbi:MAG: hypothetical protein ACLQUZ_16900 [Rhizomicrobium sp.]
MDRIPVAKTISGAYGFAFGNILSVLGIIWFPYVILAAIAAGAVFGLAPGLLGDIMHGEIGPPLFFAIARVAGVIWLASIVIHAMVMVGLQQKALGRHEGNSFFFFSLDAPVWRMIGAMFLAFLVLLLIFALTAAAAAAASFAAVKFVPHGGNAIAAVAVIAAVLWCIYASVRLTFLLPAVVVAEERIGLGRSWELGGGNFWRMVAVFLAVFVPAAIGLGIVSQALIGPFIAFPPDFASHFGQHMTPEEIGNAYATFFISMSKQMVAAWPVFLIIQAIETVIYQGLGNGMIANAYLGVTSSGSGMSGTKGSA